jgi:hypothetical protein
MVMIHSHHEYFRAAYFHLWDGYERVISKAGSLRAVLPGYGVFRRIILGSSVLGRVEVFPAGRLRVR